MKYTFLQLIKLFLYLFFICSVTVLIYSLVPIQAQADSTGNYQVVWYKDNLSIQEKIKIACEVNNCDSDQLLRIAKCESNFRNIPNSTGSGAFGIFQFIEPTFHFFAKKYGGLQTNTHDWKNPDMQIVVASLSMPKEAHHWVCK